MNVLDDAEKVDCDITTTLQTMLTKGKGDSQRTTDGIINLILE
jgi:hypothetical protein